jgi:ABC-type uncharacterized transport system auxiliary subunit
MMRPWIPAVLLACAACAGAMPETRYYQLVPPDTKAAGGDGVIVLETLHTDSAYDDDRIVYRTTPFRLDYYQYQRWSSAPGVMVGNYLEQALEHSGKFRSVVREMTPDAPVVLTGRVLAIEEVDKSKVEWLGRIVIELQLTDARTGASLWTKQIEETEPLRQQTPEGLAQALSIAMTRIVAQTVPEIAALTAQQAVAHDTPPAAPRVAR